MIKPDSLISAAVVYLVFCAACPPPVNVTQCRESSECPKGYRCDHGFCLINQSVPEAGIPDILVLDLPADRGVSVDSSLDAGVSDMHSADHSPLMDSSENPDSFLPDAFVSDVLLDANAAEDSGTLEDAAWLEDSGSSLCAPDFYPAINDQACFLSVADYRDPDANNPCADYGFGDSRVCILDTDNNGQPETFCFEARGMVQLESDDEDKGAPYDRWGSWATLLLEPEGVNRRSFADYFGAIYAHLPVVVQGIGTLPPTDDHRGYIDRGYACKDFSSLLNFAARVTFISAFSRKLVRKNAVPWSPACLVLMSAPGRDDLGICPVNYSDETEYAWLHNELICASPRSGTLEEEVCVTVLGGYAFSLQKLHGQGLSVWNP